MTDLSALWQAADIPPWLPLIELSAWIKQAFGHAPERTIPLLLPALKGRRLRHRVAGLQSISSPGRPSLPVGFEISPHRTVSGAGVCVSDWGAVGFDPAIGTVAGRYTGDRHVIEVEWQSAEHWERGNRAMLHRIAAADSPPPTDAAAIGDGPAGVRKAHSARALEAWYNKWVRTWPASLSPPTEAQDVSAATQEFPGLTRQSVRNTREAFAPIEWRQPGPRKRGR